MADQPYPTAETVPAADPSFPILITKRAQRRLAAHMASRDPYGGPCLLFKHDLNGSTTFWYCDADEFDKQPVIRSTFGRTRVACAVDAIEDFADCTLDLRSYPPGPEQLTFSNIADPDFETAGRLAISIDKLRRLHPELLTTASTVTKVARAILSVTSLVAKSDGSPGWIGRMVGEDDPGGQAEAIEAIAARLWHFDHGPAVVVQTSPMTVAIFVNQLDHVMLYRYPDDLGWSLGERLIASLSYGWYSKPSGDFLLGPGATGEWNEAWCFVADCLTDDAERLNELKHAISEDRWIKTERLGQERLQVGHPRRDGRPWCSRVATGDQGRGAWKRKGGYLK